MQRRIWQVGHVLAMLMALGGCASAPSNRPGAAAAGFASREQQLAEQSTLIAQANAHRAAARYEEAEALYVRALALAQDTDGPDSLAVAAVLRDYAALLRLTGDVEDAASMEARMRQIVEASRAPAN